ncbi:hypothetical protein [Paraburkholderia phenoliruptrix]|uniref:hypothetical protein n=1 Tax=Paraburkholderia phenoliruptrix TaxID=252970 RepID=UPI0034CF6C2C
MGAPRGRDVFADLERAQDVIAKAPPVTEERGTELANVQPEQAPPAPQNLPQSIEGRGAGLDLNAIRALKPRKEPTLQTNARMPMSLLDDIDLITRLTGITKTEIMVDGTRREVARLKAKLGLE